MGRGEPAPIGPGSVLWDLAGDARNLLVFPAALVLQVAHPAIGDAVAHYSTFTEDPWGRAQRSLDAVALAVFGGPAGVAEGRRLRRLHGPIAGVDGTGRRYRAVDPDLYAWVHGTAFWVLVTTQRLYGTPLDAAAQRALYAEVLHLGDVLRVPRSAMAPTVDDYWAAFEATVATTLVGHPTARAVLLGLRRPAQPPWLPGLLGPSWWPVQRMVGPLGTWLTIGALPPAVRALLGLSWSAADDALLRLLGAVVRGGAAVTPEVLWPAGSPIARHARRWAAAVDRAERRATVSLADRAVRPANGPSVSSP
jgi:uncharacterized protein (DUF2236 family)